MANFNFNKAILGGRLVADPELKHTQAATPVCSFRIAVSRRKGKDDEQAKADFIDVVAWRQQAEFLSQYFHKGSSICVVGSIQTRSWEDNQGQKRYATEVVADEISFVDSKGEGQATPSAPSSAPSYMPDAYKTPQFEDMAQDDDFPFGMNHENGA